MLVSKFGSPTLVNYHFSIGSKKIEVLQFNGTNGGIGRECDLFVKNLASKLALKQNEQYGNIMTWLRTKLSFETVKAALLCVRGSRAPFRRMQEDTIDNFRLNILEADL